jgi:tetratricopeptide (TPR) repeat protein
MSQWQCAQLIDAGRLWLGWLANRRGDLAEAAARFEPYPALGWAGWVAGRQALGDGRYAAAVAGFEQAVTAWKDGERYPKPGLARILAPKPDLADAVYQLGAAQYLARQYQAAVGTLEAAVKARPENAHAMFVRGLARAGMGQAEAALTDYQLASRMALAHPDVPNSGALARYYRGVWQFRRGDFVRAEDEFASALNQDPGADLRADATGWRYMAAVAGGACEASSRKLEAALKEASGFFPRREAETLLEGCRAVPANVTRKQP